MGEFFCILGLCISVALMSSAVTTRTITSKQVSKAFEMCESNIGFDAAEITENYAVVKCMNGAEFKLKEGGE